LQRVGDLGSHVCLVFSLLSFCTGNIIETYYMRIVTGCELISSWQQSTIAQAPSFNAMLSCWHDMGKKTLQTRTLLNDFNSYVARSKTTDVATTMREEKRGQVVGMG
jgi:hypothetical protein